MQTFKPSEDEIGSEVRRRLNENTVEALFIAVSMNKPLIVSRILGSGGDFGDEPSTSHAGRVEGHVNPNSPNPSGATALHIAALRGHTGIGRILCVAGANPNALFEGSCPLHLAVSEGFSEFCSMLLQHGAQVNKRDGLGFTPLHLAAVRNNRLLANLLIASDADPTMIDGDGKTVAQRWNFNAINPACRPFLAPNEGYEAGSPKSLLASKQPPQQRSAMSGGGSGALLDPTIVDKVLLARFKGFKSFQEERQVVVLPEKIAAVQYSRTIATDELKQFFMALDSMGAPPALHERQIVDMLKDSLKIRTSKVPLPDSITFDEFCVVWLKAHAKGLIPT